MESGKVVSTGAATGQAALCPQGAHTISLIPPATLIVVVEVEPGQGSSKKLWGFEGVAQLVLA